VTEDRAQSYGRLMALLRDIDPAALEADERERIRDAADTLVLAPEPDGVTEHALADVDRLAGALVDSGRWELEAAERLVAAVAACGPRRVAAAAL
jgi:hypothetical protein